MSKPKVEKSYVSGNGTELLSTEEPIGWMPDPRVEEDIRFYGLSFVLEVLSLGSLNSKWIKDLQIRDQFYDEGAVAIYEQAMRQGRKFPALVVIIWEGKYVVVGGVHRYHAAIMAGRKKALCYIVPTDDLSLIHRLAVRLNRSESVLPMSQRDLIRLGLDLVRNHGWTAKKAAQEVGVSESALHDRIAAEKVRERLNNLHEEIPDRLASSTLAVLNTIDNDNVLIKTARLAERVRMTEEEATRLAKRLRSGSTETAKLRMIEQEAEALCISLEPVVNAITKAVAKPDKLNRYAAELRKLLVKLLILLDNHNLSALGITTKKEQKEIFAKFTELEEAIKKLRKGGS